MNTRSFVLIAVASTLACRGMSYDKSDDSGRAEGDTDTDADGDTDADWDDTGDWGSETEEDFLILPPATTDAYVFVANPDRDTLTRVSVPSLEVITVDVGNNPAAVATTADYSKAISFNAGSNDLSIVDAESLDVVNVPVRANLNAMSVSPDGQWAVVYHDADVDDDELDDQGGAQSFNELSLVDTTSYEDFPMVVGANPRQVQFTESSDLAIVVSDQYLAMIDLTAATPGPTMVQIADDLLEAPVAEELEIAPDGSYAFVRQYGEDDIVVVDLASYVVERVGVGYNPTDLDITPDGAHAVVVSRGDSELWMLSTADPFAPADVIELPTSFVLGSLSMVPDGSSGVLYTTAVLQDRYATWDVSSGDVTVRSLVKPVGTMSISPTGQTLLVFHTQEDAVDADPDGSFYGEWALSMIDLEDFRANPLTLGSEPLEYANSGDGAHGYFVQDDVEAMVRLDYDTLLYEEVELKSQPEHVGVLPTSNYAWVSQVHDLGRISFYDPGTEALETITGFELNSEIEH
jgi:DNA-binding beta-propeller fold protein YncE